MKNKCKLLSIVFGLVASCSVVEANTPYITKVYDFLPAPGQFVNGLPEYKTGDTREEMLKKVEEQICGNEEDGATPGMISLGAYGGYVTFGFDHTVANVTGEYDFKVYGNAFVSNQDSGGGSCEPGIVMVSYDSNGNGMPDDEWYELAGSAYGSPWTQKNYSITYYKPASDRALNADPDPDYSFINDRSYVKWTTSTDSTGYVMRNTFHNQSYWPEWVSGETLTFTGTRLPNNGRDTSGTGLYYVLYFYDWGYVDNRPNNIDPGFKIEWAVDKNGKPVNLPGVDFVKVYCAENQSCGWLGETSTEVCGGEDLHPDAVVVSGVEAATAGDSNVLRACQSAADVLTVYCGKDCSVRVYALSGMLVMTSELREGTNVVDISALGNGAYIVRDAEGIAVKFLKR